MSRSLFTAEKGDVIYTLNLSNSGFDKDTILVEDVESFERDELEYKRIIYDNGNSYLTVSSQAEELFEHISNTGYNYYALSKGPLIGVLQDQIDELEEYY